MAPQQFVSIQGNTMTSSQRSKTLYQLGLSLLLVTNLLLWSSSWNSPAFHDGQYEQPGDSSPPFLVGSADGSDDEGCAANNASHSAVHLRSSHTVAASRVAVARRIRIASYPVSPQAPPALV
jgi:hypothetical protein